MLLSVNIWGWLCASTPKPQSRQTKPVFLTILHVVKPASVVGKEGTGAFSLAGRMGQAPWYHCVSPHGHIWWHECLPTRS